MPPKGESALFYFWGDFLYNRPMGQDGRGLRELLPQDPFGLDGPVPEAILYIAEDRKRRFRAPTTV